ncbi:adenylyl-sulfate kinase, partial [Komagataeibacter kakiaceti]|uniref:adenylyl-sulfate kinase n=1 Tax=Komagataeibacter kakiaceti TaxID=943261 RepID=UPI000554ECD7
ENRLFARGVDVSVLDGDTLRAGLCSDLGFSDADRRENVRRAAAVARILAESGQVVIVALISPTIADRELARQIVGDGFHEIFIDTLQATCEQRDPKGLYAAARAGKIAGFTGIDAPYEAPTAPALRLETAQRGSDETAAQLASFIGDAIRIDGAAGRARS